jgi:hypothetical protein
VTVAPLAVVAVVAAVALAVASCGSNAPTPPVSPSASAEASHPSPGPTSPPASATTSASASTGTPPSLPPGVSVDPGLLEVLPGEVDGVALQADPDTAAQVGSDPLLAESALSIVVAIAAAPGASDSEDLAVASVIRLRPDVFDEAFYQEWRDTYDEAACEVADGVESQDATEIDGRLVYLGTCVGGARTYHTYLVDQGFIVSITATGERRFGELIMAGLTG